MDIEKKHKNCFGFILVLFIILIIVAVIFLLIKMNKKNYSSIPLDNSSYAQINNPQRDNTLIETTDNLSDNSSAEKVNQDNLTNISVNVPKDIDMLVYSAAPLSIDSVIQSIFEKKSITNAIEELLEMGEDEFTILRAIQRYVTQLYMFHIYIKLHGRADAYEITGRNLPKIVSDKIASIAIRIRLKSYLTIFEELLKIELQMKDSKNFAYKDTLLFGVLAKIQSVIS